MAAPRGHKKWGGRAKGTKNKNTLNAKALAEKLNCDPLEILLRFAMGDWEGLGYDTDVLICQTADGKAQYEKPVITPELRQKAAKDACDFLYPRKKAIEHKTEEGTELRSITFKVIE